MSLLPAPILATALVATLALAATAHAAEPTAAAVGYIEYPEDGPQSKAGRRLTTAGRALNGVDINSSIDVKLDAAKLQTALLEQEASALGPRAQQLQKRLAALRDAVQKVDGAARETRALIEGWKPGDADAAAKLRASASSRLAILTALGQARRQRLAETGGNVAAGNAALNAIVMGPNLIAGYDWALLGRLLNEELAAADADFRALASQRAYGIEIQSHLLGKGGQATPIALPGYNDALTGAAKPFTKLQFSSEGQLDEYKRYEELASQRGESKDLGEAILKLLEAELQGLRSQLEEMTQGAQDARERLRDRLASLEKWGSAEARKAWLAKVEKDLGTTPEGRRVLEAWKAVEEPALTEIKDDIAALRVYADLRGQLAGKTAPETIDALLRALQTLSRPETLGLRLLDAETWAGRLGRIEAFTAAVEALKGPAKDRLMAADGPYADLKSAHEAFTAFVAAVRQSAAVVKPWIAKLMNSGSAQTAANLALPPGHRRLPLLTASDLGTRVDLQRVPARREVGDTVRMQYAFFQGEAKLASWTDEFSLRSYGWNSEVLASLALTRQGSGAATWKAAPAMNWILSNHAWPGDGQAGLAGSRLNWFSGAGVSVMPLDSGSNEGVKLGLAATLAFLNNRVLVGAGANLQSTSDKRFVFFSIRLLDFPGLSGPLGGGSAPK